MKNQTALAVVAAFIVTTSGVAALAGATVTQTNRSGTISSCTTIETPGTYELNETLRMSGDSPCLVVDSDDVIIDGNGHTIAGSDRNVAVRTNGTQTNVTVRNLTFVGDVRSVVFEQATNSRVRNVTTEGNVVIGGEENRITQSTFRNESAAVVREARAALVADTDFAKSGVTVADSQNVTVTGNDNGEAWGGFVDVVDSENVSILGNDFNGDASIRNSQNVTVADNEFTDFDTILSTPDLAVVFVSSSGDVQITGNTLNKSPDGIDTSVNVLIQKSVGPIEIANNTLEENGYGVEVERLGANVTIRGNEIRDYREAGIFVHGSNSTRQEGLCGPATTMPDNADYVEIRRNTFDGDGFGVQSEDPDDVVNATHNYWGSDSGPSSPDSVALKDPATGALADGSGVAVSADPSAGGVSNVHFDPWLQTAPVNKTANDA